MVTMVAMVIEVKVAVVWLQCSGGDGGGSYGDSSVRNDNNNNNNTYTSGGNYCGRGGSGGSGRCSRRVLLWCQGAVK